MSDNNYDKFHPMLSILQDINTPNGIVQYLKCEFDVVWFDTSRSFDNFNKFKDNADFILRGHQQLKKYNVLILLFYSMKRAVKFIQHGQRQMMKTSNLRQLLVKEQQYLQHTLIEVKNTN